MLATRDQLAKYLRTSGTVSAGAAIDSELLDLILAGATSRLEEAASDRTLEPLPALQGDPLADTADPVELAFPITGWTQRVVQVPDLRELVSATVDDRAIDLTVVGAVQLRRRPRELCALWLKFRSPLAGEELRIVGRWGPAGAKLGTPVAELDVRPDIRDAVLVWAARAYHNRTARFADSVQDPSGAVSNYFRNLPPDVKNVVDSLVVPGV